MSEGAWPRSCGSFVIPAGHPCLPGHFPGDPVVPGVVLLDHALALVQAAFAGQGVRDAPIVRFRRPVRPAQAITVQVRPGRRGALDFTGSHEGAIVLSGSVRLTGS